MNHYNQDHFADVSKVIATVKGAFVIFILLVSADNLHSQNTHFDFAFNIANCGWGMNLSSDLKEGNINYNLLNLYVEHKKTNIGIEISPFNCWTSYNHSDSLMNFVNVRLYYNFARLSVEDDNGVIYSGSDYLLIGPFVSLNYVMMGNNYSYNPNNTQINIGFKMLVMFDYSFFWERSLPLGFQLFSIEFGYRYNNYYKANNHQFYFNLSTDILVLLYIIGVWNKE